MKQLLLLLVSFLLFMSTNTMYAQDVQTVDSSKSQKTALTKAEKEAVLYEKLNSEQLLELKRQEMDVEMQRINNQLQGDMPLNSFGIVIICLLPFAFVFSVIYINAKRKNTESKRKYDLYMKSLEMGQTIPEHFFDEPKQNSKASNLQRGVILLMVGLSFGLFVVIKNNTSLPFLLAATIPSFVGIGYLIIHFLEKPKQEIPDKNDEQIG